MIDPDRIYDICQAIKAAVITYYGAQSVELPPRQYVANGPFAIMYDCPQLVVSCEKVTGYQENPALQTFVAERPGAGHAMRSAIFQVSVVRAICPDPENVIPVDQEEASAAEVYRDAGLVLNALITAEKDGDLGGCSAVVFLDWTGPQPDADVAAGTTRVQLSLLRA